MTNDRQLMCLADESPVKTGTLLQGLKTIFAHILFVMSLIGSSLYRGYLTNTEYWVARSLDAKFDRDGADLITGLIIFVSSMIGSLIGGRVLDHVLGTIRIDLWTE